MCTANCITFGATNLSTQEVEEKSVLEVGSCNVNGSLRALLEPWRPLEYIGVDIAPGRGVDEICDVGDLVQRFGESRFDLVVATEVMEHVRDWRAALTNIKRVCRPGGVVLITTRSEGFPHHAYPYDFWRYELSDMRRLFTDFTIAALEDDPHAPGVLLKATKPAGFVEADLQDVELFCIFLERRVRNLGDTATVEGQMKRFAIREELYNIKRVLRDVPKNILRLVTSD